MQKDGQRSYSSIP